MVGLVCSVNKEASALIEKIKNKRVLRCFNPGCISGKVRNKRVVLFISGVGKVNAAHATTVLINKFKTQLIINFGIAGAFPKAGLSPGDVVLSEEEVYADEGVVIERGFSDMKFMGIPIIKGMDDRRIYNVITVNKGILRPIKRILEENCIRYISGRFITVSTVTGTTERAEYLWRRFRPLCESMEGAAVAHIATLYNKGFIELRGISNYVGKRDKREWDIESAVLNCTEALLKTLECL